MFPTDTPLAYAIHFPSLDQMVAKLSAEFVSRVVEPLASVSIQMSRLGPPVVLFLTSRVPSGESMNVRLMPWTRSAGVDLPSTPTHTRSRSASPTVPGLYASVPDADTSKCARPER